jgi:hypothetical protein
MFAMLVLVASAVATSVAQPPTTPDATPAASPDDTPPPHRLALNLGLGLGFVGNSVVSPASSLMLAIDLGYHVDRGTTVGLHVSQGVFTGSISTLFSPEPYTFIPVTVAAFASQRFLDICWAGFMFGAHFDRTSGLGMPTSWSGNVDLGFMLGVDVVRWNDQSVSLYATTESEVSDTGFAGAMLGVAYRR